MSKLRPERRRHERIPMSARVTLTGKGKPTYLFTRDVSIGGCAMLSDDPIPVGRKMILEFSISGVKRLIKVKGKVVRHFDKPEKGFGVMFTRFMPYSKLRLTEAFKKMVKA